MEEWKEYKIGDLGRIVTGKTPKTSIKENYGGDIPFLTPSDDLNNKYAPNTIKKITNLGLSEVKNCLLPPNSICVSCIGSDLGKVVMLKEYSVTNQQFNSIIPNEEFCPDFIYYLMTIVGEELNFIGKTSTAVPIVNKSSFSNTEVTIPSLPTQQKIANILSSLDDKIEVNRRINDNLEQQAQALFDRLFFEDLQKERKELANYAEVNPTRTITRNKEARCIEMANLPSKGSFPNDWMFKSYSGGMKFQNGDTIMARITPCLENGKTAYINFLDSNEIAFGSTEYIVLSAKEGFCPALFYFLARNKEFVDYAVSHMNGSSGRQRVGGVDIANFPMPHISLEDSAKFAEIAMPIMDVIKNNSLENRNLATLRDTLLPKLMSGELSVDDVSTDLVC